jgi:hypothetical protein
MLSAKHGDAMTSEDHIDDQQLIVLALTKGIQRAHIDFAPGQSDLWVSTEDAALYAQAALNALKAAGYRVVRADA